MATPPTTVGTVTTTFANATTPKAPTSNPAVQTGDVLVAFSVNADSNGSDNAISVSGGGLTWTEQRRVVQTNLTEVTLWSAVAGSNTTITDLSFASIAANFFGGGMVTFRGSDGISTDGLDTTNSAAAPSLAITTATPNEALVVVNGDWTAQDGTTRTWRTVNGITPTAGNGGEKVYFRDAAQYTAYAAVYSDSGAVGSKTVGLSAPGGQSYSLAAIGVKGAAGGTPTFPFLNVPILGASQAAHRAANI